MSDLPNVTDSNPVTPSERKIHNNVHVLNELKKLQLQSTDAFGKAVTLGTTNKADLASHYDYNPERLRVFVDGVRQFIQYDGFPAQFSDLVDSFLLSPQADGEVVKVRTAERFRYVVQYVTEWSLAFQLSEGLNTGDVWAVALGDPDITNSVDDTPGPNADGWIVYQNSSHDPDKATIAEYRLGTELYAAEVTFNELPLTWGRLAASTNWYNVGETSFEETYTEVETETGAIVQRNNNIGTVANNDGKGPSRGNFPVTAEFKTGSTSAGSVDFELGSIGVRTLGDVTALTRAKAFGYSESIDATNAWIPVLAIRRDPTRDNVAVQFDKLSVLEFTGSDDAFAMIIAFDPENVADTNGNPLQDANFSNPPELNAFNSVIEVNTNVDQVADGNGVLQTAMQDPGGFQLAYASQYSSGAGGSAQREKSDSVIQKRLLSNGDYGILMVRSPSTGTIKGQIATEQDW